MTQATRAIRRVLLALLPIGLAACGAPGGRVNVLFITLDTTRPDHLSCYGYPRTTTPYLESLKAGGVLFRNAFCEIPSTLPSHAVMLTGRYPIDLGVRDNNTRLPRDAVSLAERFRERGYRTAAFVSSFVLGPETGIGKGFDVYDATREFETDRLDGLANVIPGWRPADRTTDRAIQWLAGNDRERFFLWVHYYDPHFPYTPPPEFDRFGPVAGSATCELYERLGREEIAIREVFGGAGSGLSDEDIARGIDLYDGAIAFMDASIGRLLDALGERAAETLVIAVADHGESFGEHGKTFCHFLLDDACMRVPLIMALPGRIPAGRESDELCSTIDLAPTILDLTGLPPAGGLPGRSLSAAWESRGAPLREFAVGDDGMDLFMLRRPSTKIILSRDAAHVRFFDLEADPGEMRNAAELHPDRVRRDTKLLLDFLAEWEETPGEDRTIRDSERMDNLKAIGYFGGAKGGNR